MEIVAAIVSATCGVCVQTCIAEQCTHFKNSKIELENLKNKIGELKVREHHIKTELHKAKEQEGKDSKKDVQQWLQNVEEVTKEMDNIDEKFQVKKKFLKRIFCNCYSGENSGKYVAEKINEVIIELLEKGKFPNGLVVEGTMLPPTTLVGRSTAERTLEMIWASLVDNEVTRIGVCGMGGVGKTTIMTNINNKLLKETTGFDKVIWVTVSKPFNVEKLQENIAKAINIELDEDIDEMRRAGTLFEGLAQSGRYVLILDDMWEDFPLKKVGIPEPSGTNGCKIVITTRSLEVCRRMSCQAIKAEVLAENEAWNLFMDKIGHDVVLTPEVEEVAEQVCEECSRLPLAIITIGSAMSGVDDIREWRKTLNDLRRSITDVMGMEEAVFEKLKFSYHRLKDEKLQKCFLYCALYPEDERIYIEELITYWIAEGLIDNENRQEDFDEGHVILNTLKNTCLLEGGTDWKGEYVKMHDLLRDMALNITRVSPRCMIKAWVELQEQPNEEEWTWDLERVSLMFNKIETISCKPYCPNLSVLLLQQSRLLREVSDTFFEHMHDLKVLDLAESINIEYLPDSLSNLENLRALILYGCQQLRKVPSLAKLKELRELDLSFTGIEEVPQGMENLVKLKRLHLIDIRGMIFSDGILPQLASLQDLKIVWTEWETPGNEELSNLKKLEIIELDFSSISVYNRYARSLQTRGLRQFDLQLHRDPSFDDPGSSKRVHLGEFKVKGEATPLVIPDNTNELTIRKCHDVTRFSQFCFSLKNARELKIICIYECEELECILSGQEDEEEEESFLQSVEKLHLWKLDNLRNICMGIMPRGFLSSLKVLQISECNNIKKLFSHGMLPHNHLQNLESISIDQCRKMEEMIGSRGEEEKEMGDEEGNSINANSIITLPKLKELRLRHLPKLKRIYSGALFSDSLQTIDVWYCGELRRLPIVVVENENTPPQLSTPALQQINGVEEWWDSLEWDHSQREGSPMLRVEDCSFVAFE